MRTKTVICAYCGKEYQRRVGAANEAIKMGWKQFCSKFCHSKFKDKKEIRKCTNCGKEIKVFLNAIKKSKVGHFFCTNSCAAHYNNSRRIITAKHRQNIAKAMKTYCKNQGYIIRNEEKQCIICNKLFKQTSSYRQRCCSKKCGQIYQFGSLPYTKEETLNKILELSKIKNRTPIQKEADNKLVHAVIKFFGSWNKVMKELNLKPNPTYTEHKRKVFKALDGHKVDSLSELIIDNWLTNNNFKHERNKLYGTGKITCDFYLPDYDIWLEYFGMLNKRDYKALADKKINIAIQKGYKLITIIPKDLYPFVKLKEIIVAG